LKAIYFVVKWRPQSPAISIICVALYAGAAFSSTIAPASGSARKHVTSGKQARSKKASRRSSWKSRGQQAIDKARAREIQQALIRENYLQGEPSGMWDVPSKKAMQRFQAERGWQTKVVPDSRALIELGLGPKHENIINPETAMTPTAIITPVAASASQR
jgi:hypothetical protein